VGRGDQDLPALGRVGPGEAAPVEDDRGPVVGVDRALDVREAQRSTRERGWFAPWRRPATRPSVVPSATKK
jgi:hypothetical protein